VTAGDDACVGLGVRVTVPVLSTKQRVDAETVTRMSKTSTVSPMLAAISLMGC